MVLGLLATQTGWACTWMVIGIDAWIIRALVDTTAVAGESAHSC